MIETKKNRNNVRVTFTLPDDESLGKVSVVGDFNDWEPGATPLVNGKNDTLNASVRLNKGQKYAFRYLSEGRGWMDEEDAHSREKSPYGSYNCILNT